MIRRSAWAPSSRPRRRKLGLPKVKERKQLRSPAHLKWVRGHECCIAGRNGHQCQGRIEAMHVRTGTDGGMGVKPSDNWAVPGCSAAHAEQHRIGEIAFERKYEINLKILSALICSASAVLGRIR